MGAGLTPLLCARLLPGERSSRKRCQHQANYPIYSYGGDLIALLCRAGHVTPTEVREKKPPRCEHCGCRSGHATGCANLADDAWDEATQHAEAGDFEESALWLEVLMRTNFFNYLPDGVKIDG